VRLSRLARGKGHEARLAPPGVRRQCLRGGLPRPGHYAQMYLARIFRSSARDEAAEM
jgi:hypothetical protein